MSINNSNILSLSSPVVCIVGPTASGKTDLAQIVASKINGEVVSADSMQIYRGMDIGTGKLPKEERIVPHHGFDLVDPGQPYSAALFQEYARSVFKEIDRRGKRIVLCGGTGFYVRAAIDGYDFPKGEQEDNPERQKWMEFALRNGSSALWQELHFVDPKSAEVIPPNDVKRVVRAFELLKEGTSYYHQKQNLQSIPQVVPACFIGLSVDPQILRERIDRRVDSMVAEGLIEEVRTLLNKGLREGITSPQAIGYKEIVSALDGCTTIEEAVYQIKMSTRHYAKRQRTWFRKDKRIAWINANDCNSDLMANEAMEIISSYATIDKSF